MNWIRVISCGPMASLALHPHPKLSDFCHAVQVRFLLAWFNGMSSATWNSSTIGVAPAFGASLLGLRMAFARRLRSVTGLYETVRGVSLKVLL